MSASKYKNETFGLKNKTKYDAEYYEYNSGESGGEVEEGDEGDEGDEGAFDMPHPPPVIPNAPREPVSILHPPPPLIIVPSYPPPPYPSPLPPWHHATTSYRPPLPPPFIPPCIDQTIAIAHQQMIAGNNTASVLISSLTSVCLTLVCVCGAAYFKNRKIRHNNRRGHHTNGTEISILHESL